MIPSHTRLGRGRLVPGGLAHEQQSGSSRPFPDRHASYACGFRSSIKRTSIRFQICVATVLVVSLVPRCAKGDGGILRLREAQGPFLVTVFSTPEAAAGRLADVSVLVQGSETGKVVLDADVSLTLSPPDGLATKQSDGLCGLPTSTTFLPGGMNHPASVRATREQASNKLLYAAPVELNAPGDWKLHVLVYRGTESARFDCRIPVILRSGKLTVVWPFLVLPPLAVLIFAINQWLRRQSLQKGLPRSNAL